MQAAPRYDDVVSDVVAFLEERLAFAVARGSPGGDGSASTPGSASARRPTRTSSSCGVWTRSSRSAARSSSGSRARARSARCSATRRRASGRRAASLGAAVAAFERGAWMLRVARRPRDGRGARRRGGRRAWGGRARDDRAQRAWSCSATTATSRRSGGSGSGSSSTSGSTCDGARGDERPHRGDRRLPPPRRRSSATCSPARSRLLLEGLAGTIADAIVERFGAVERVRVRVRKPDVVLDPPVEHAAVVVERRRR